MVQSPGEIPKNTFHLTVGVVTHDNNHDFRDLLKSLECVSTSIRWELFVVDNQSGAGARTDLRDLLRRSKIPTRFDLLTDNNLAYARQYILDHAHGTYVLFTDPDCQVPVDWLTKMFQAAEENFNSDLNVVALGGGNRSVFRRGGLSAILDLMAHSILGNMNSVQMRNYESFRSVSHLPTFNLLLHRDRLATKQLRFDLRFSRVGEDLHLSSQIARKKLGMIYVPNCEVLHNHGRDSMDWFRKVYIFGQAQFPVLVRYPRWLWSFRALPIALVFPALVFWRAIPLILGCYLILLAYEALRLARGTTVRPLGLIGFFLVTHFGYLLGWAVGFIQELLWLRQLLFKKTPIADEEPSIKTASHL